MAGREEEEERVHSVQGEIGSFAAAAAAAAVDRGREEGAERTALHWGRRRRVKVETAAAAAAAATVKVSECNGCCHQRTEEGWRRMHWRRPGAVGRMVSSVTFKWLVWDFSTHIIPLCKISCLINSAVLYDYSFSRF